MENNKDTTKDNRYTNKKCFVIMPYGIKKDVDGCDVNFDDVYHKLIEPAVSEIGLECDRCDEKIGSESIHKKMFRGIFDADVSVVDITSLNPNVFYELGVRHTLHKHITVVIRKKSNSPIPFNIAGLPIWSYEIDNDENLKSCKELIQKNVLKGLEDQETDSIVHDTLSDLRVEKTAKVITTTEEKLYSIKGTTGKQIGYITGNIKDICNVDVWVNSENTNMQMARPFEGSISATIRYEGATKKPNGQVATDLIQDELTKVADGPYCAPATVLVTSAGELENSNNVKRIFHAASVEGAPGRGYFPIKNLTDCIRNALRQVDSKELAGVDIRSIIFPMMGTGTTRSSAEGVADQLVDTALQYVKTRPNTKIEKIYFLAYNEITQDILEDIFSKDDRVEA